MVFKTILNKDILNMIFDYSNINVEYEYYKRASLSVTGFKNIKIKYNCLKCEKKLRNTNMNYGFVLYHYEYYNTFISRYSYNPSGITLFYHNDTDADIIQYLRNVYGDITESPYHISIQMMNTMDNKVLGKLILNSINKIKKRFEKLERDCKYLNKCKIDVKMTGKNKKGVMYEMKKNLLNTNDLDLGYYCKKCCDNKKYYSFIYIYE